MRLPTWLAALALLPHLAAAEPSVRIELAAPLPPPTNGDGTFNALIDAF